MKNKLIIFLPFLFIGCTSTTDKVHEGLSNVIELTSKVGNVEYRRNGFWTNSNLTVDVNDTTRERSIHYDVQGKMPGGPSVSITIDGIEIED
jgi:hypothetical protein